jgi:ornithine cyclodeaminase
MIAESSKQAVCEADIICAAMTSEEPVFDGEDLRNGTHINGVGSFTPRMREIDFATLKRSKIVVDSRENALADAGELVHALDQNVIAISDIYAEIGEIAGRFKAGRENEEEITFFKSVGNAVQDAAIAHAIYRNSLERRFGVEVNL